MVAGSFDAAAVVADNRGGPSGDPAQPGRTAITTQPIIFDLINQVVLHVGADPAADKQYAEIVAAQQQTATAASGFQPTRDD
jgi:hypothetical protein